MLDLYELKQLVAFEELGTLSKVADTFHVSTPSVTRTMQHLEECFGVVLFVRGKNRIELNETGKAAVVYGRKLIQNADETVEKVRSYDQRRRTIVIRSCAPAPLWEILKKLNSSQPEMMIASAVCQNDEVLAALQDHTCDIAILPFPLDGMNTRAFMRERLYVCVPREHQLAGYESLSFEDINGFNFLLRTELGFWDALCRQKMPATKFLVQTDEYAFNELVVSSSLPCFSTDYGQRHGAAYEERVNIPIRDPEADVTFYVVKNNNMNQYREKNE